MSIVSTTKDPQALTLTIVAEFAVPPERVWQVWSDPRQLEQWWGPPTWPATFERHEMVVGGSAHYFMTGPEGDKAHGWWRILALDEPHVLEFEDGFADDSGQPNPALPTTRARVELEQTATGTRMTLTSTFATAEDMEQIMQMGVVEGLTLAMGQIDALLEPARR